MKNIYIILSRSHTMLARSIQFISKKYYNHTSISFDDEIDTFYSFGRKNPRYLFPAGFITESIDTGFFGLHPETKICILKMPVSNEDFASVLKRLKPFTDNPNYYKYSLLELPCMTLGIPCHQKRKFVCSVFVAYLLDEILDYGKDYALVEPEDFFKFNCEIIYEGTAGDYAKK